MPEETERECIIQQLTEQKETAMIARTLREQGRKEEAVTITSLQLTTKFHLPKEELEAKLSKLTLDNLHELSVEIFGFQTADAVFQWIDLRLPKENSPAI